MSKTTEGGPADPAVEDLELPDVQITGQEHLDFLRDRSNLEQTEARLKVAERLLLDRQKACEAITKERDQAREEVGQRKATVDRLSSDNKELRESVGYLKAEAADLHVDLATTRGRLDMALSELDRRDGLATPPQRLPAPRSGEVARSLGQVAEDTSRRAFDTYYHRSNGLDAYGEERRSKRWFDR